MAKLDANQIAVLIAQNGKWAPKDETAAKFYQTATAIALAESGGDTNAKNPNSSASGLFQIMVSAHKDKIGGRDIFDPAVNVDVARMVYQAAGNSWSPWQAYTTGAYKKYMDDADLPDKNDFKVSPGEVAGNLGDAVSAPFKLAAGITQDVMRWLASGALVIGASLLALVLFGLGVWLLLSNTKAGKTAGDAAKSAALMAATKGAAK